jgi:hypothetical protein
MSAVYISFKEGERWENIRIQVSRFEVEQMLPIL